MNGVCLINITRTDCFFQTIDTYFFLDYMTKLTATITFKKQQIHTNTQKMNNSKEVSTFTFVCIYYFNIHRFHAKINRMELRFEVIDGCSKKFYYIYFTLGFKVQHTLESLKEKYEKQKIHESQITKEALLKLMKITTFMVKKHWAHTYNYENFVRFIGEELHDKVLSEYLALSESHKNATYLSTNAVTQFIKVISDYIFEESLLEIKESEHLTILMDESTDESNRSQLSVICRVVKNAKVENYFLDLLNLSRCDAETIFHRIESFLREKGVEITRIRFAGMDGCSTMSGEHNGVRSLFERSTNHFTYIHCRNHRLALCFAHLIPLFEDFKKFDGLLNLYLLLKNSSVKQAIFDEVQKAYELTSLKLIKAAVTRWLSHGKAAQRVLDRFETLVAALDEIYLRKSEPAVRGLRDDLVKPKTIAILCFLADI